MKFKHPFSKREILKESGTIETPNIAACKSGNLTLNLPANWKDYDVLYITATDNFDRQINTWSWNISTPKQMATQFVTPNGDKIVVNEKDSLLTLQSGIHRSPSTKKMA